MTDEIKKRQINFAMFVMYRLAESWRISVSEVYRKLEGCKALENYLFPFYDVLHTQGSQYLVSDLTEYVKRHGETR